MDAAIDTLSKFYGALAHPVRREIIAHLARGEARVGEVANRFAMSGPAITNHLQVLERAGLVRRRVKAQARILALEPEALRQGEAWISGMRKFWKQSLDRLGEHLAEAQPSKAHREKAGNTARNVSRSKRHGKTSI